MGGIRHNNVTVDRILLLVLSPISMCVCPAIAAMKSSSRLSWTPVRSHMRHIIPRLVMLVRNIHGVIWLAWHCTLKLARDLSDDTWVEEHMIVL